MLANTSVICSVVPVVVASRLTLLFGAGDRSACEEDGDKGSTWTISSHVCTIDLMRELLPIPLQHQPT